MLQRPPYAMINHEQALPLVAGIALPLPLPVSLWCTVTSLSGVCEMKRFDVWIWIGNQLARGQNVTDGVEEGAHVQNQACCYIDIYSYCR